MPKPLTVAQIFDAWKTGKISQREAENALDFAWAVAGYTEAQRTTSFQRWIALMRTTPKDANGFALPSTETPTVFAELETRTDPLTAYLARLGIGGKQSYNPAEAYQASLFDPFKSLYDIQERLHGPGGPYQDESKQSGTFANFMDARGGLQGLMSGAKEQLRNIFGGTTAQKTGVYNPDVGDYGLGYEPGKGAESELGGAAPTMDAGQIAELQRLLNYGLRGQVGSLGAAYAARRIPRAQQAYYGQKVSEATTQPSFLDWLKQNWGLQF